MGYHQVDLGKKYIIGLELRTTNQDGKAGLDIPLHWQRFYKENILEKIPHKVNSQIYVLYTDYEGDFTKPYSYIVGCEVSSLKDIPAGLVAKDVPKANYAHFSVKGPFPESLIKTWQEIWSSHLNRAYTSDFEIYEGDFDPQKNAEINIYIALK